MNGANRPDRASGGRAQRRRIDLPLAQREVVQVHLLRQRCEKVSVFDRIRRADRHFEVDLKTHASDVQETGEAFDRFKKAFGTRELAGGLLDGPPVPARPGHLHIDVSLESAVLVREEQDVVAKHDKKIDEFFACASSVVTVDVGIAPQAEERLASKASQGSFRRRRALRLCGLFPSGLVLHTLCARSIQPRERMDRGSRS